MARRQQVEEYEDYDDEDNDFDQVQVEGSTKIIDWYKVCTTPFLISFQLGLYSVMLIAGFDKPNSHPALKAIVVIAILGAILAPFVFIWGFVSHLKGTKFDVEKDKLSYPYYVWRLKVPLSGIRDANTQTTSRKAWDIWGSIGESHAQMKTIKHYNVNLSGNFGVRRLMFRSKFKRDQFLSLLRLLCPHVRITRWA